MLGELPEDLGRVMCNVAVTVAHDPRSMEPAEHCQGIPPTSRGADWRSQRARGEQLVGVLRSTGIVQP